MVGRHHRLNGCEFEPTSGDSGGQGSLACCNARGRTESDTTERLSNNWFQRKHRGFWKVRKKCCQGLYFHLQNWALGEFLFFLGFCLESEDSRRLQITVWCSYFLPSGRNWKPVPICCLVHSKEDVEACFSSGPKGAQEPRSPCPSCATRL